MAVGLFSSVSVVGINQIDESTILIGKKTKTGTPCPFSLTNGYTLKSSRNTPLTQHNGDRKALRVLGLLTLLGACGAGIIMYDVGKSCVGHDSHLHGRANACAKCVSTAVCNAW